MRRLDAVVRRELSDHYRRIARDVEGVLGKKLQGREGLWAYRFRSSGGDYRIAYEIVGDKVLIVAVGPREHFYERLRERLR